MEKSFCELLVVSDYVGNGKYGIAVFEIEDGEIVSDPLSRWTFSSYESLDAKEYDCVFAWADANPEYEHWPIRFEMSQMLRVMCGAKVRPMFCEEHARAILTEYIW